MNIEMLILKTLKILMGKISLAWLAGEQMQSFEVFLLKCWTVFFFSKCFFESLHFFIFFVLTCSSAKNIKQLLQMSKFVIKPGKCTL